jgi:hypothetical protein
MPWRFQLPLSENRKRSWAPKLKPVVLATQEAEIRRIVVQDQPGKKFERAILKIPN